MLVLDVSLTIGLGGEAKVTDFAFKWLLSGVATHVLDQVTLV